ncbi:hypothetical protein ElyMa_000768400 [Elysia marginata]|uniref:Uncharacterized protein n=1 Tax=Elysia marginata TaxID=1093978 RepID=A0AAV4GR65_9GAST|nr:hypothetical protein ElyMa_000768400 [Elysia marginata]
MPRTSCWTTKSTNVASPTQETPIGRAGALGKPEAVTLRWPDLFRPARAVDRPLDHENRGWRATDNKDTRCTDVSILGKSWESTS